MNVCFICLEPSFLQKTNCCNQYVHDICICEWLDVKVREKKHRISCPHCKNYYIGDFWEYLKSS